jgi:hypothetical protein
MGFGFPIDSILKIRNTSRIAGYGTVLTLGREDGRRKPCSTFTLFIMQIVWQSFHPAALSLNLHSEFLMNPLKKNRLKSGNTS